MYPEEKKLQKEGINVPPKPELHPDPTRKIYLSQDDRVKAQFILSQSPDWVRFILDSEDHKPPNESLQNAGNAPFLMENLSIKASKQLEYGAKKAEGSLILKLNPKLIDPNAIASIFSYWYKILNDQIDEELGLKPQGTLDYPPQSGLNTEEKVEIIKRKIHVETDLSEGSDSDVYGVDRDAGLETNIPIIKKMSTETSPLRQKDHSKTDLSKVKKRKWDPKKSNDAMEEGIDFEMEKGDDPDD